MARRAPNGRRGHDPYTRTQIAIVPAEAWRILSEFSMLRTRLLPVCKERGPPRDLVAWTSTPGSWIGEAWEMEMQSWHTIVRQRLEFAGMELIKQGGSGQVNVLSLA